MQRRNQLEWLGMCSSPVSFQRMPHGTTVIIYQCIAEVLVTLVSRESRCLPDGTRSPMLPIVTTIKCVCPA